MIEELKKRGFDELSTLGSKTDSEIFFDIFVPLTNSLTALVTICSTLLMR